MQVLISPTRVFVSECTVSVQRKGGSEKRRHLMLFNDVLLILRRHHVQLYHKWKYVYYFEFSKMRVTVPRVTQRDAPDVAPVAFVLSERGQTYAFRSDTEQAEAFLDLVKHTIVHFTEGQESPAAR